MSDVVVAALIGSLGTLIAAIIGFFTNISLKKKVNYFSNNNAYARFLKPDENFSYLLGKAKRISMYTVNSHELLNEINKILERNSNIMIKKLVIMVRMKANETKADLDILKNNIRQWENWVNKKRIKNLTIIGYNHDPDHYYTIIEDRIVFAGQILFDKNKPTGTNVDYLPLVFSDESEVGKQVIKNYQRHFDNVVSNYKDSLTLYDSSKK